MTRRRAGALVLGLLVMQPSRAGAQWSIEAFFGSAASAPSPLTIHQAGEPDLRFTAHYATRPTEPSVYYAVRFSHWWGRWGGFVGFVHHKLYLTNTSPEVEFFRVTYGYNLGGVGVGYLSRGWTMFGSVGPVVSNPASTVRGMPYVHEGGIFSSGNYIDGFNVQLGVNRRMYLLSWGFLTADARVSAAWASMPIAQGSADTPNFAFHLLVGIGVGKKRLG